MFSPSRRRSIEGGQEPTQQQHHDFPLQQGDPGWRQNLHLNNENDGGFGPYSPPITGSGMGPAHDILPNNCDYGSSGSFERYSRHGTLDSYNSSHTSYSLLSDLSLDCIDPKLTQTDM